MVEYVCVVLSAERTAAHGLGASVIDRDSDELAVKLPAVSGNTG